MKANRYTYASGYKSIQAANDALESLYAEGTVSPGEFPEVESYNAGGHFKRVTRYRITLAESF